MKLNGVVKYGNDINTVPFGTFNAQELDLFFSICFHVKEQGTREITISFDKLKNLSNYVNKNLDRFIKDLSSTYDKMLKLNIRIDHSERSFTKFSLFNKYTVDAEKKTVLIKVSEEFKYLLNGFLGNYTKFDLIEFVNLKSSYSKNTFKLLKQWESLKCKEFNVEEFRTLLGVPETYSTSDFNKRILRPIMTELKECFHDLKLEKFRNGKKISKIKFSWSSKPKEIVEDETTDLIEEEPQMLEISAELDKAIAKAKHNRFLKNLLCDISNIEILVKMFSENDLIRGLLEAYKGIKSEIYSINYLIKTIKSVTEITKNNKQIIVIQRPLFPTEPTEKTSEEPPKIDITQQAFEEEYKKHLKTLNLADHDILKKGFALKYNIIPDVIKPVPVIEENQLLGKNGKKLTGIALTMRLKKLKGE